MKKGEIGGWEGDRGEEAVSDVESREEGVHERGEAARTCAASERGEPVWVLRSWRREATRLRIRSQREPRQDPLQ